MTEFADSMTLKEAQDLLRTLIDEGHKCPCCTQFAKVYKRKLHTSMATGLIVVAKLAPEWVPIADVLEHKQIADFAKLRYWGLVIEEPAHREDGSGRTGYWRVTGAGHRFVDNTLSVPSHARVYDGRSLGLTGKYISIRDALGDRFDYGELMAA